MRHVFAFALALLSLATRVEASGTVPAKTSGPVTILLQFDQEHNDMSLEEMKRELTAIMKEAGLKFEFRMLQDVTTGDSFNDLVVVKFRGKCRMDVVPQLLDERGPLAFTHSADGRILPFSEVECDRIRLSISSAMYGADRKKADLLLGRALGRVVAHEIYHIVGNTKKHGHNGVAKTSLSATQLISDKLVLHEHDVDRIQHGH
ncbi:MAG TPA: hypothetical protein VE621_15390 [Bryobacteraceae bacterium]|nr:hypothetical protein [Bryobacteraceae bacterium]